MTVESKLPRRASVAALVFVLSSCGATTYDESRSTTVPSETSVAPLPAGGTVELLVALRYEMEQLSSYIGPRPDDVPRPDGTKRTQLEYIERIWAAVEADIVDVDALDSLSRMMDLARVAVERNRPADADKAAKFAGQVIASLVDDYR